MVTQKKAANAIGGNTARACDSCLVKRARWFCAADDAFLCQRCDSTVHSANQLASRHERVRLQTASSCKSSGSVQLAAEGQSAPAWHRGFKRKARTPRPNNKAAVQQSEKSTNQEKVVFNPPLPFVPEIGCEETNCFDDEENEDLEQLLYRVPIYDPFSAELCNLSSEVGNNTSDVNALDDEVVEIRMENNHEVGDDKDCLGQDGQDDELGSLQGFLPSDMELAEFAEDVENLLGGGLEEDSGDIKGVLGLLDDDEDDEKLLEEDGGLDVCMKAVKVEGEEGMEFNPSILDWSLDYDESSPMLFGGKEEEEKEEKVMVLLGTEEEHREMMMKRKIFLRLNHEAVIAAWASQGGSPWTTGTRPEFNPDDAWPDSMCMWPSEGHQGHGDGSAGCVGVRGDDRGREARVSRYREKRRTRLFSKKIRYEVRKLNAEKRPRMKGRFVKRTSASNFLGSGNGSSSGNSSAFPYTVNK